MLLAVHKLEETRCDANYKVFFFLTGFREFQGVGVISLHWSKNLQEWANVVKC